MLDLNDFFNWCRRILGMRYWSLSKYVKIKVKRAAQFIESFEEVICRYAKDRKYDGVICGHIHTPEIKTVNGITYMNDGDWVESCSALVEHIDGRWEIVYWNTIK
jgi:UDP-2,3-diacylglucosamine pyrophosphatase LpxH